MSGAIGKIALVCSVIAGLVSGGLMTAAPAQAAAAAPAITQVSFDSESIQNYRSAWINATWEIPGEAKAPVKIVLPLPQELRGNADQFPMMNGADEIGECVVTETEITCSVVDRFVSENPLKMSGGIQFGVSVNLAGTTTGEQTFEFGDLSTTVTVESSPGVCESDCEMEPLEHRKAGRYHSADHTIDWTVQLAAPTPGIAAGQEIRVWDELDPELYTLVGKPKLYSAKSLIVDPRTGVQYPRFELDDDTAVTVSENGLELSFTSLPGLGADYRGAEHEEVGIDGRMYQVVWTVKANDNGQAGTYSNTAAYEIAGTSTTGITGEAQRQSGSAWGVGTNAGAFELTKKIGASSTDQLANLPEFLVQYTAKDSAGVTTSGSFTVAADDSFRSPEFLAGTIVTIEEVLPTNTAAIAWQQPVFAFEEGHGASIVDGKLRLEFTQDNRNLGKLTQIVLTNSAELQTSSFSASKKIVNEGGVSISPETSFTLNYSYPADPELGFVAGSGALELPSSGAAVHSPQLPIGAVLEFSEEIVRGEQTVGGTWQRDKTVLPAPLTISDAATPIEVELVNTITRDTGAFSVSKTLTGSGVGLLTADLAFDFEYRYPAGAGFDSGTGTVTVPADGTAVTVEDLPAGAEVTLTEALPAVNGGTWSEPVFSESNTFTVDTGTTVAVEVVNEITLNTGSFQVQKKLAGSGASLVPDTAEFTVDYSYPADSALGFAGGAGTVMVQADGTVATSAELPFGAEVTLAEQAPAAVPGGTWQGAGFVIGAAHPAETVTFAIGAAEGAPVELTNTITGDPGVPTPRETPETPAKPEVPAKPEAPVKPAVPAEPTESEKPAPAEGGKLAATGADLTPLWVGGGATLLLGAALLLIGRMRRAA